MRYCDGCHFPIVDAESDERRRWCRSIRGILKLEDARPEDYHENCFVDVLFKENKQASTKRKRGGQSLPPHADTPSHSWMVRDG